MKIIKGLALTLLLVNGMSATSYSMNVTADGGAPFTQLERQGLVSTLMFMGIASVASAKVLTDWVMQNNDYAAFSHDSIEKGLEESFDQRFFWNHPSSWIMSESYYNELRKLRTELVRFVRLNNVDEVKRILAEGITMVDYRVAFGIPDDVIAPTVMVPLVKPIKIESYDPVLKFLIALAIKKGLPEITEALCTHAQLHREDAAYYIYSAQSIKFWQEAQAAWEKNKHVIKDAVVALHAEATAATSAIKTTVENICNGAMKDEFAQAMQDGAALWERVKQAAQDATSIAEKVATRAATEFQAEMQKRQEALSKKTKDGVPVVEGVVVTAVPAA